MAVLTLWSCPDPELVEESSNTYWTCKPGGSSDVVAINVKRITTVVSMHPDPNYGDGSQFYAVYKPGQTALAGILTGLQEEDGEDNEE